jgi:SEC-C motif
MRETWSKTGRNEPCPCGSKKKYKNCHAARSSQLTPWQRVGLGLAAAALVGGLVLAFVGREDSAAETGVWSPEHGHYH